MPFDLCRIGQLLKDNREQRGLTLDEVAKALFIKKGVIEAIESADWESLPPLVYVKGYVNQYAAVLRITDLLEAEMRSTEKHVPAEGRPVATTKKEGTPKRGKTRKKLMPVAAVAAALAVFLIFQGRPRVSYAPPPVATSPVASPVVAKQSDKPVLEQERLTIVCQERTWVRIDIDGRERKEFMLNPEDVVMLTAKENFDLLIGNAGGVKLFYNGKDTDFTGKTGEVKHVSLP